MLKEFLLFGGMPRNVITFGELLLTLTTPGYGRISQAQIYLANLGGAEANVAVSLANFGVSTEHVSRIPRNPMGQNVLMNLRMFGVGTNHMLTGGNRLGLCFAEKGNGVR